MMFADEDTQVLTHDLVTTGRRGAGHILAQGQRYQINESVCLEGPTLVTLQAIFPRQRTAYSLLNHVVRGDVVYWCHNGQTGKYQVVELDQAEDDHRIVQITLGAYHVA